MRRADSARSLVTQSILKDMDLKFGMLKVQMKCFFLFPNLKEQQKSGRSPFTVS